MLKVLRDRLETLRYSKSGVQRVVVCNKNVEEPDETSFVEVPYVSDAHSVIIPIRARLIQSITKA